MMSPSEARLGLTVGVWFAAITAVMAGSVAAGATASTSALLLFVFIAPMAIMLLIGSSAPPPRVSQLLHAVNTHKDGRR